MAIKRVLLDACVPHRLRYGLNMFDVQTAHFAGLDQQTDTDLLASAEGRFDVIVTLDQGLLFQQSVADRSFGVVLLRVPTQAPDIFAALAAVLVNAIELIRPGQARLVAQAGNGSRNWTQISVVT